MVDDVLTLLHGVRRFSRFENFHIAAIERLIVMTFISDAIRVRSFCRSGFGLKLDEDFVAVLAFNGYAVGCSLTAVGSKAELVRKVWK
jgi:hypothetical protein